MSNSNTPWPSKVNETRLDLSLQSNTHHVPCANTRSLDPLTKPCVLNEHVSIKDIKESIHPDLVSLQQESMHLESDAVDNTSVDEEDSMDQAMMNKLAYLEHMDAEEEEWFRPESPPLDLYPAWDPFHYVKDMEELVYMKHALLGSTPLDTHQVTLAARTQKYDPKPMLPTHLVKTMRHHRYVSVKSMETVQYHPVKLKCQKSSIHAWGVYADQPIAAHTMVIEFVGEIVRQQVAEARERQYVQRGIGSRYLFRVDEDIILDATKKGNMARFINHCCTPNCSIKIMMVHQQKKVMMYANRDIEAGEEITYDYKLPTQTQKIPCHCASKFCKGTLN